MKRLLLILILILGLPLVAISGMSTTVVVVDGGGEAACDQVQLPTQDAASISYLETVARYDTSEMRTNRFLYAGTNGKAICQVDLWVDYTKASVDRNYYVRVYSSTFGDERLDGTQTGSDHATLLIDSAADWDEDELIGLVISNKTDNYSTGSITDNDATSITVSGGLSGGTEDDFDNGDEYFISTEPDSVLGTSDAVEFNSTIGQTQTSWVFSSPTSALTNGSYYFIVFYAVSYDSSNWAQWYKEDTSTNPTAAIRVYSDYDPISWSGGDGFATFKFKLYSQ